MIRCYFCALFCPIQKDFIIKIMHRFWVLIFFEIFWSTFHRSILICVCVICWCFVGWWEKKRDEKKKGNEEEEEEEEEEWTFFCLSIQIVLECVCKEKSFCANARDTTHSLTHHFTREEEEEEELEEEEEKEDNQSVVNNTNNTNTNMMHRGARSKGIGRKFEHTARATHLSRKKTKDAHEAKAAFMEAFLKRKKDEEKKGSIIIGKKKKTTTTKKKEEVPVVHGSTATPEDNNNAKVDLKTCVSEPGEEILVTSLKSRSGGVVGKMAYVGKAFPVEKRKKIAMARKAEIEVALEQKLEKELEGKGDEGDDDEEEKERPELPTFIGSMSKKKKKHNKKMLRRSYTK